MFTVVFVGSLSRRGWIHPLTAWHQAFKAAAAATVASQGANPGLSERHSHLILSEKPSGPGSRGEVAPRLDGADPSHTCLHKGVQCW